MKDKIIELRAILPIPIMEAKKLLADNASDIETCVYLYTAKAINEICERTGCDAQKADFHYRNEKFDINRAVSAIMDEIYDVNYKAIEGVNKESLLFAKDWIYIMESKDFATSLSYIYLHKAIDCMLRIPKLKDIGEALQEVKKVYDNIFEGYDDNQALEEFVRRSRKLDDAPEFLKTNKDIPLQVLYIKNEISKHWRNS